MKLGHSCFTYSHVATTLTTEVYIKLTVSFELNEIRSTVIVAPHMAYGGMSPYKRISTPPAGSDTISKVNGIGGKLAIGNGAR